jgi:hypothetical protein
MFVCVPVCVCLCVCVRVCVCVWWWWWSHLHSVIHGSVKHPHTTNASVKRHPRTAEAVVRTGGCSPRAAGAVLVDRVGTIGVRAVVVAVVGIGRLARVEVVTCSCVEIRSQIRVIALNTCQENNIGARVSVSVSVSGIA